MIVAVTGSRHATERLHRPRIEAVIRWLAGDHPVSALFHGDADGVDRIADGVARALNLDPTALPADWDNCAKDCPPRRHRVRRRDGSTYCTLAGFRRNQQIIDQMLLGQELTGESPALLAFPILGAKNAGTDDCIRRARGAGIPQLIFPLVV